MASPQTSTNGLRGSSGNQPLPHWRREHFVPIRRQALVDLLLDQPDLDPAERRLMRDLSRLLVAFFHHEMHGQLTALKNAYAPFDPDDDTCDVKSWSEQKRDRLQGELYAAFQHVLERANYLRLSQLEVEQAVGAASEWGVRLHVDFSIFQRLDVFARGDVVSRRRRRSWRTWFREESVEVPIYQRLAVIFSLKPSPRLESHVDANAVYLKLFKNIPKIDVDMLLPGSRVRMTLLDRGKIILPTVSGAAVASAKLVQGALWVALTGTLWGIIAFLGFVAGLIGYGVRSFFGYLRTKDKYQLSLTRNLYYQNLDNNAGVLYRILDEAEEQETREALLAYFLLWKRAPREGWTVEQLDEQTEQFLRQTTHVDVDFECRDALAKLSRLGLAEQRSESTWQAVPPTRAIARLDAAWDNLFTPP